ncbi:unnamed protein product, partial [Mesorhabditis belari]|uniref:Uncharacterized protein n=1 Tax=Mesorhabditis belari TaxID=2138241 RepID=A0AAF3FGV4_9BILA
MRIFTIRLSQKEAPKSTEEIVRLIPVTKRADTAEVTPTAPLLFAAVNGDAQEGVIERFFNFFGIETHSCHSDTDCIAKGSTTCVSHWFGFTSDCQ